MFSRNVSPKALGYLTLTDVDVHPDYQFHLPIWAKTRAVLAGEEIIKQSPWRDVLIPRLAGHDNAQYDAYVARAPIFNIAAKVARTQIGVLFRKPPQVRNARQDIQRNFTGDGKSIRTAAKLVASEVYTTGRVLALVDASSSAHVEVKPYVAFYRAEQVLDWNTLRKPTGEVVLSYVLLREGAVDDSKGVDFRYRVLRLQEEMQNGIYSLKYVAEVYESDHVPVFGKDVPVEVYEPTVRGQALDHIPAVIFAADCNGPEIQQAPILPLVHLTVSHIQASAQLAHGRFYTASPVYTVSSGTGDDGTGEYYVGPDMVWELGRDGKASILEYNGSGLISLERALQEIETQAGVIAGRFASPERPAPAETEASVKSRRRTEAATLQGIADSIDEGFLFLLGTMSDWANVPRSEIETIDFTLNRDWLVNEADSRLLRAMESAYRSGSLPGDVFAAFFKRLRVDP